MWLIRLCYLSYLDDLFYLCGLFCLCDLYDLSFLCDLFCLCDCDLFCLYYFMFHYLLASLHRADGAKSVTSTGVKTFNIFAGLGEHRWFMIPLQLWWSGFWPFITDIPWVHRPLFTAGSIMSCYSSALAKHWKCCRSSPRRLTTKSTPSWTQKFACKFFFT